MRDLTPDRESLKLWICLQNVLSFALKKCLIYRYFSIGSIHVIELGGGCHRVLKKMVNITLTFFMFSNCGVFQSLTLVQSMLLILFICQFMFVLI